MAEQDKISILGPRDDGTYVIEFRTVAGERLAISVPSDRASLLKLAAIEEGKKLDDFLIDKSRRKGRKKKPRSKR